MTTRTCNGTARAAGGVLVGVVVLVVTAAPAVAAPGDSWTELKDFLGSCDGTAEEPATVTLTTDIDSGGEPLTVACVAEVDLTSHDLTVRNVVINGAQQLTVDDTATGGSLIADASGLNRVAGIRTTGATLIVAGGAVTATGGFEGAGIGGGYLESGGTVTVTGGTVTVTGGRQGAGVGGGRFGSGGAVTVIGGTVTVTGGFEGSGIGGGQSGSGGTVTVTGGTVTATGGSVGAGIGGGLGGSGGTVTVNGGTVTATGDRAGAGIGGGFLGSGGTVTVAGGTVAATGGEDAAGIGGGESGSGGVVEVGAGAVVTATGGHTAIGAGADGGGFGSLLVEGTLAVPSGDLRIPDSNSGGAEVTVTAGGGIVGGESDPRVGAQFLGDGQVDNGGVIALSADRVLVGDVAVLDHHYRVAFDPDGGTPDPGDVVVFAPSFDTGHRDLPADPSRDTDPFLGWTTQPAADDPGELFAAATVLPGSSSDGAPVEVGLVARWGPLTTGLPDGTATTTAGEAATFTPQVTDSDGNPFPTDPADWTISDADGAVEASIDPADGEITVSSTTAGTHELELTVPLDDETATVAILLVVEAGPPAVLDLDTAATAVDQGETIAITVTGTDEFGNSTGDLTDQTTFTSDVATDVIDGNHITFPTASPHTITATHPSGATATTTIEVTPAPTLAPPDTAPAPTPAPTPTGAPEPPAVLPDVGTSVLTLAATGLVAIGVGAALISRTRPRHRHRQLRW